MTDGVPVQHLLRERVAEEVRALLARKMMTGAELALAIGKSPMYVSRRVRGEVAFDLDDMERIAHVLGVSIFDLLPKPAATGRQGTSPNEGSSRAARSAAGSPLGGPFGQKPGLGSTSGLTRPASIDQTPKRRRPALVGPGRRM